MEQMQTYTAEDFAKLERFNRVSFFNSISGMRTPFLVGTADASGQTNLAVFNSVVHIGADPPLLGMVFRPATVPRHTLNNILQTGEYTLNAVSLSLVEKAHQTSAKYPKDVSEFDACDLEIQMRDGSTAPFVREARLQLTMQFREKHHIAINDTIFLVGEIVAVHVSEDAVASNGEIIHDDIETALVSGLDAYYGAQKLFNIPYARP